MYNEHLEKLVEIALTDGELKEKEKKVLFKKAEALGIDLDEFEMVLEAKLYEKKKGVKSEKTKTTTTPKSNKFGDVKKCPACGSIVQYFQTKCIDCDHEFSNIEANTSINKLFEMLNDAENERKDEVMSIGKTIGKMFAKAYGFGGVGDKVNNKKISIIKNFPIPTSKNDILEFLSLAVPNAKKTGNFFTKEEPENKAHNTFVPVWKSKCEQIIMKARFSMKEDNKTLDEINNYAKELKIK